MKYKISRFNVENFNFFLADRLKYDIHRIVKRIFFLTQCDMKKLRL